MFRVINSVTLIVCTAGGCASFGPQDSSPPVAFETDAARAVRCLCLWSEGEATSADGRSTRGFAGQIYFFTADGASPVAVEGDVRVFLFDDIGTPKEQARPVDRLDISAEEFR